jgi:hypothetical protein
VTGEPVSHVAIECAGWIIHSNLLGVHVELPQTFYRHSTVLYAVDQPFDMEHLMQTLSKYDQHSYDFGGLLYLGLQALIPWLPKKNLWQQTGMFLCTEWVTSVIYGYEDHMITPYQLYLRLSSSNVVTNK